MNSFLKWAGSKRSLISKIAPLLPSDFVRYVEPFAGSACLFFHLEPRDALLADVNEELVNTFIAIKQNVDAVVAELEKLPFGSESYYNIRASFSADLPLVEQAAKFIYLNRYCFNGLYRTNRAGRFNVPFGGLRSGTLPTKERLKLCGQLMANASIRTQSFEVTLGEVKSGDFVYIDPPYSIQSRRIFNEYSNATFGDHQLKALRSHLERLNTNGIPFLVSYGFSREGMELSRGFRAQHLFVQRQIAGFSKDRRKAREIIITNF